MPTLLRFALEQSILNAFGILLGIATAVLIFGSLLDKRLAGPLARTVTYAGGGAVGGVWSYMTFDKEPTTQYLTILVVVIALLPACLLFTAPFVYWRSKRHDAKQSSGSGT